MIVVVHLTFDSTLCVLGMAIFNLAPKYAIIGDFHRAIERAREALRVLRLTLPPSHPLVGMAQQLVCSLEAEIGADT